MNELFYGCIGGSCGTIACYPFDTIKTRLQAYKYNVVADYRTYPNLFRYIRSLYQGLPSPLITVAIEKSILFWCNNQLKQNKYTENLGSFWHGFISGILTTLIVTPPERIKIKSQTMKVSAYKATQYIMKYDGILSIYRGWTSTLLREVPGYGIYFTVYDKMKQIYPDYNPVYSWISGMMAGVSAWAVIYPSDSFKTVMQNDNIGISASIKKIYKNKGLLGFYKGYSWALCRAAILHSVVILSYDTTKYIFQLN